MFVCLGTVRLPRFVTNWLLGALQIFFYNNNINNNVMYGIDFPVTNLLFIYSVFLQYY